MVEAVFDTLLVSKLEVQALLILALTELSITRCNGNSGAPTRVSTNARFARGLEQYSHKSRELLI
jgi:hypothetical protein